jgi:two-component system chemotaxis sensor kinase CheA
VVVAGLLVDGIVQRSSRALVQSRLDGEATMLGQMTAAALFGEIDPSDRSLHESVRALGRAVQTQLSLLAPSGVVVADSDALDVGALQPQGQAAEIVAAAAHGQGQAIRGPPGEERLYVARSIERDGKLLGFARSSLPMAAVRAETIAVRERMISGAAVAIAIAFGLSFFMSWRIVRPVKALSEGAREIGAGRYGQQIEVESDDELGQLAQSFNEMSRSLRGTIDELDGRNRDMRVVLDNVREGLLTVALDGTMSIEKSAAVEAMFGPCPPGARFWDYVLPAGSTAAKMMQAHWQQLAEDVAPVELSVAQMPRRIENGERLFDVGYIPVFEGGRVAEMLVVVADVTAQVKSARAEEEQREVLAAFERVLRDRAAFLDFATEAEGLVELVAGDTRPPADELRRALHTLKGISGMFGATRLAGLCHDLEQQLNESHGADLEAADRERLRTAWRRLADHLGRWMGERERPRIEIDDEEIDVLLQALRDGASRADLVEMAAEWRLQRVDARLARFAEPTRSLALRLGKGDVEVSIDCPKRLRLDREAMAPVWSVLTHVLRNAVDHGLTSAADREPGVPGRIQLAARRVGDAVMIDVTDDGRGIDWDAIGRRAAARGLPHETAEDRARALFADGFSTRGQATMTSGRGVGLSAVRRVCEAMGGSVSVDGGDGGGTRVRLVVPVAAAMARSDAAAISEDPFTPDPPAFEWSPPADRRGQA